MQAQQPTSPRILAWNLPHSLEYTLCLGSSSSTCQCQSGERHGCLLPQQMASVIPRGPLRNGQTQAVGCQRSKPPHSPTTGWQVHTTATLRPMEDVWAWPYVMPTQEQPYSL